MINNSSDAHLFANKIIILANIYFAVQVNVTLFKQGLLQSTPGQAV